MKNCKYCIWSKNESCEVPREWIEQIIATEPDMIDITEYGEYQCSSFVQKKEKK